MSLVYSMGVIFKTQAYRLPQQAEAYDHTDPIVSQQYLYYSAFHMYTESRKKKPVWQYLI